MIESTGATIASIITVVAVFDINIPKHAVIAIIPSIKNFGLFPKGFKRILARLTSSLYLVAPMARPKPPKNRMITGDEKQFKMFLKDSICSPSTSFKIPLKGNTAESDTRIHNDEMITRAVA